MTLETRIREHVGAGDVDAAATAAIRGYGPEIVIYLRSLLRDDTDACDAFSRFAEKLWRSLPAFRAECSLRAHCYRIAWSEAQHVREDAFRRRREPLTPLLVSKLTGEVPESSAAKHEREAEALAELRGALTPDERSLLALRVDQGLSWKEVAEVLACAGKPAPTHAAVRKRFERTKGKVAALARDRGLID
ncbi:MAG: RNA polymerase sigma factor [Anaeromyxobacteraceae bacterium]